MTFSKHKVQIWINNQVNSILGPVIYGLRKPLKTFLDLDTNI